MLIWIVANLVLGQNKPSPEGQTILRRIIHARELEPAQRAPETVDIAHTIAKSTTGEERVTLLSLLVGSVTEGDLGQATVQSVADTLVEALRTTPAAEDHGQPGYPYVQLAQLRRYEGVSVRLRAPDYRRALKEIEDTFAIRSKADFDLKDLNGNSWRLSALKGKVVVLNFWATWCPPCRKEMPDLQALYDQFGPKKLVVLAVSDEDPGKVRAFAEQSKWTFPVLLDSQSAVGKRYRLESLPKTFVYDRGGRLVATAIDMRSREQFLRMLAQANLK